MVACVETVMRWYEAIPIGEAGRALALIFQDPAHNQEGIMILGMYHPKRGGANPDFDEQSMQILRLKDRDGQAIASFYKRIEPLLGSGFSIAVVPSRDAARTGTGMSRPGATTRRQWPHRRHILPGSPSHHSQTGLWRGPEGGSNSAIRMAPRLRKSRTAWRSVG